MTADESHPINEIATAIADVGNSFLHGGETGASLDVQLPKAGENFETQTTLQPPKSTWFHAKHHNQKQIQRN